MRPLTQVAQELEGTEARAEKALEMAESAIGIGGEREAAQQLGQKLREARAPRRVFGHPLQLPVGGRGIAEAERSQKSRHVPRLELAREQKVTNVAGIHDAESKR